MVYSFKTSEVKFLARSPIAWTLDGEFGGEHKEVVVKNLRQAIEIVT